MNMIENVAKALALVSWQGKHKTDKTEDLSGFYVEHCWKSYIPEAKAALQAMREPTPEMLKAGYGQHYRLETKLGMSKAVLDYDDMIKAALKETGQ